MEISAALVKELRERTGAGMMDCKRALQESEGDIEAAIEAMRKSGVAKAAKKAGRVAAEGVIVLRQSAGGDEAIMVEVNCETDFVAKDESFQAFSGAVADTVLAESPAQVSDLDAMPLEGGEGISVEETRQQLVAKLGENIGIRRFTRLPAAGGRIGAYVHGNRIGVLVRVQGGDETLAKDLAMHIAASRPLFVDESQVPAEALDKEREIFAAQAAESGKPAAIIEKMVQGRVSKFVKEITLLGQPFVKDPDQTVGQLLKSSSANVDAFERFEVGEGIERKSEDFAAEVMAQARGH